MIVSPFGYLFALASLAAIITLVEQKSNSKFFKFLPAVVLIYLFSMTFASMGAFEQNEAIDAIYENTKKNLLPAMLFLMLLQIDFRDFFKLGKSLIIAYVLAVFSLAFAFVFISFIFDFNKEMASAFGALSGSWMGGVANMIAVGSALNVSQEAFGYALIVDSVNYTIWIMFLLFLTPFASYFNSFTSSHEQMAKLNLIGCSCTIGAKRYYFLILLAIIVAFVVNFIAQSGFELLNYTTTTVILATLFGVLGSFTRLKTLNGSSEVATTMLYMLIALIGSKAIFDNFSGVGIYVFAGFCILVVHAALMVLGAKIFKLDLFSIAIASLANIGGVASASILAATYNKALVGIGVLMAIMGYIVGTFGGLAVGKLMLFLS
ncbi:Protein of unknown function DUF819 [Sulfurimonas denitrificans DSM 1251]|jgi:uncharacterized membrane protein|uniref:DUF819 domain-containing protein n=1 Tax=Sulfurimonas denitrificans (strain ATCC 33889 / DSM 1251) TaxID=326298 RepID=Q30PL9_SULDN|nr:DUF819 family protein [Sulfurimonas denitrificans]ABB45062.1 Protein of unknown function DUF819 [Sulfurimonas denitrificans DSM 1251]MDD3442179.1 DUF819 family protein [Sulfurimonas denitrificans]